MNRGDLYDAIHDEAAFAQLPSMVAQLSGGRSTTLYRFDENWQLNDLRYCYFSDEMITQILSYRRRSLDTWGNVGFASGIVANRYDAGVRLGEALEQDMIAVPISPILRMAAFASPSYLARQGTPLTPYDLADHNCISLRMSSSGGLYAWEFERGGKELRVKAEGQLVFNDAQLIITAALAGRGIAFMIEDHVLQHFSDGSLVRVLDEWCEPFDGYYLYYTSRRQPSPAFKIVLEALRYRSL